MFLSLTFDFFLLLLTFRKKSRGLKVFGKPKFQGGPFTKFNQLQFISVSRFKSYSSLICLSSVYVPILFLKILKLIGVRLLVNQNGVYYPSWYSKNYKKKNVYLKKLNAFSHHTFFQSEFALRSYKDWVGPPPANYSILYNPVDMKIFYPATNKPPTPLKIIFFYDFQKRNSDLWKYCFNFIEFAEKKMAYPHEWIMMGRTTDHAVLTAYPALSNIQFILNPGNQVPEILRTCHVAVHLVYNDVCPNKVLECMASGIWVITHSAGGSAELVGSAGTVIPVPFNYEKAFYPSYEELFSALDKYIKNPLEYEQKTIQHSKSFHLNNWYNKLSDKF